MTKAAGIDSGRPCRSRAKTERSQGSDGHSRVGRGLCSSGAGFVKVMHAGATEPQVGLNTLFQRVVKRVSEDLLGMASHFAAANRTNTSRRFFRTAEQEQPREQQRGCQRPRADDRSPPDYGAFFGVPET